MGGHAATASQDALGDIHALDVFRRGLETDEDDLFAALGSSRSVISIEVDLATGGTGGCRQAFCDRLACLEGGWFEGRVQQGVELFRIDFEEGFLFVDHAFGDEVDGHFEGSSGGALAVTGLEHEQLAALDVNSMSCMSR